MYIKFIRSFLQFTVENARKSLYLIVMTHSEVHIQRVHFEPEAPVLIDLVLPNSRNLRTWKLGMRKESICILYVNGSGSITSVGEERAYLSAVVYL